MKEGRKELNNEAISRTKCAPIAHNVRAKAALLQMISLFIVFISFRGFRLEMMLHTFILRNER